MAETPNTGVLLTAFGGPDCLDAVAPFMSSLMGQEAPAEAVESAKQRYVAIGGCSPLPAIAERIAAALERSLNGLPVGEGRAGEGEGTVRTPVALGMRYSQPSIGQGVADLCARGVRRVVWTSLSPFESQVSTGAYRSAVESACVACGVEVVEADRYSSAEPFTRLLAEACIEALNRMPDTSRPLVVMTAHSLPSTDEGATVYVGQLTAVAAQVAARVGLGPVDADFLSRMLEIRAFGGYGPHAVWMLAYQSKGKRGGQWLEPDLDQVIDAAAGVGCRAVVVCPIGFVTDHLETLYDLDIAAAARVTGHGMTFLRSRVPNDDPLMIEALAQAVGARL